MEVALFLAGAGEHPIIRREGSSEQAGLVSASRPEFLAGGGVPFLDRLINTAGHQSFAVG